jgi:hypothetical protein
LRSAHAVREVGLQAHTQSQSQSQVNLFTKVQCISCKNNANRTFHDRTWFSGPDKQEILLLI